MPPFRAKKSKAARPDNNESKQSRHKLKKMRSASAPEVAATTQPSTEPYIDKDVTLETLNSLSLLLANESTRNIFFEFAEKEHSANHLHFWFAAREFQAEYVHGEELQANNSNNSLVTGADDQTAKPRALTVELADSTPLVGSSHDHLLTSEVAVEVAAAAATTAKVSRGSTSSEYSLDLTSSVDATNFAAATALFEKYLSPESPIEVNLDYRTFSEISKRLESKHMNARLFDRAIKEIFDTINNDSFHRFKATQLYKSLVNQCTEQQQQQQQSSSSSSPPQSPSEQPSSSHSPPSSSNNLINSSEDATIVDNESAPASPPSGDAPASPDTPSTKEKKQKKTFLCFA
eukprot:gene1518-1774_t